MGLCGEGDGVEEEQGWNEGNGEGPRSANFMFARPCL
jgi:hypothetical protein